MPLRRGGRRRLLRELVKIDLEYRWRGNPPAGAFPVRPRLEDYVARLPSLGPLHELPIELIVEEYRVRRRWGDRPDHVDYLGRFPRHGPALWSALARIDAELCDETPTVWVRPHKDADNPAPPVEVVQLRCPHCRHAIELFADAPPRDLSCPSCGGAFSVESLSAAPGAHARPPCRRLGRYELGDLLGTGAFGSVWQARDGELGARWR